MRACTFGVVVVLGLVACGGDATSGDAGHDGGPAGDAGGADTGAPDLGAACTSDAQCMDDGLYCNGVPHCAPGTAGADAHGCVAAAGSPCIAGQTCNEAMRRCDTACATSGDADGDGHDAMACSGDDCDDSDSHRYPGNLEVCDAAGHDEDCNPATLGPDMDGDTFVSMTCCNTQASGMLLCGADCNDTSPTISPSAAESCNAIDDNCNAMVDEGVQTMCYRDADGDGYAMSGSAPVMMCTCATGFIVTAPTSMAFSDCDDANPHVNPAVPEVCNGVDDNCNAMTDEGMIGSTFYRDVDGDGFGATASGTVTACSAPTGYAATNTDCDDAFAGSHPGAMETCDGHDNDCNGATDENPLGPCMAGLGACLAMGNMHCGGSCDAVTGTPDSGWHTTPAPNGSWDWNCDGVNTGQYTITDFSHRTALQFCMAQTCSYPPVAATGYRYAYWQAIQIGLTVPGGTAPYCGDVLWDLDPASYPQCTGSSSSPGLACTSVYYMTNPTQGCH